MHEDLCFHWPLLECSSGRIDCPFRHSFWIFDSLRRQYLLDSVDPKKLLTNRREEEWWVNRLLKCRWERKKFTSIKTICTKESKNLSICNSCCCVIQCSEFKLWNGGFGSWIVIGNPIQQARKESDVGVDVRGIDVWRVPKRLNVGWGGSSSRVIVNIEVVEDALSCCLFMCCCLHVLNERWIIMRITFWSNQAIKGVPPCAALSGEVGKHPLNAVCFLS